MADNRNGVVGPGNYAYQDAFSPKTTFSTSARFTFGLGRDVLKKNHIYHIEDLA